jgi:hypothetical protein
MKNNQNIWRGYNRQDFVTRSNRSNTRLLISLAGLLLFLFTGLVSQKFGSTLIITIIFFITNATVIALLSTFEPIYLWRFSQKFILLFVVAILHYRKQIFLIFKKQLYVKNKY